MLNDKFTNLFKVVEYTYNCPAIAANTTKVLTGSNFGYRGAPSGYTPYALHSFSIGNGHINVTTVNINAAGSGGIMACKNTHQTAATGTATITIRIAFIKTGFGV